MEHIHNTTSTGSTIGKVTSNGSVYYYISLGDFQKSCDTLEELKAFTYDSEELALMDLLK